MLISRQVIGEMTTALKRRFPQSEHTKLDRRAALILTIFSEAVIEDYESLIPAMSTRDPDDRHVLAAAVAGHADVIVTANTRDFPESSRSPFRIDVQSPDEFLCYLWSLAPETVIAILRERAAGLSRPAQTPHQMLDHLRRTVPDFVNQVLGSHRLDG